MKRLVAWMLFTSLVPACAFNSGTSMRPMDWSLAPLDDAGALQRCPVPAGLFTNEGESSDTDVAPIPLAYLLFLDHLQGFPVEAVQLTAVDDAGTLRANGVLEGVPLDISREIKPQAEDCASRWQVETDSGAVDAQLRTEAVLVTSGVFIPLSEVYRLTLELADDGALLVNLRWRGWVLGALLFPVRVDQQVWMRYPVYTVPGGDTG